MTIFFLAVAIRFLQYVVEILQVEYRRVCAVQAAQGA